MAGRGYLHGEVEAAMAHHLAVVRSKDLLDLALDEAAARDKEMDDKRSARERYRKQNVLGYDYIRGQELEVQLGVGRIIRILEEGSGQENSGYRMCCIAEDTSRSGIPGSSDKPDYSSRTSDTGALSWSLVALVMELKYVLAELYTECLGESTSRLDEIKNAQPNRKHAYAVLLCSQEIQVQKLDMADHKTKYSFSQRYAWSLNGGFGLSLLVGLLLADGRALGFRPPPGVEGRILLKETIYLDNMRIAAVKGIVSMAQSLQGCLVHRATLVKGDNSVDEVAMNICPNMDAELRTLASLTVKNVAGVLPVLDSGTLASVDHYLVTK